MVHIQDVFKDSQSLKEVIRPADEHGQGTYSFSDGSRIVGDYENGFPKQGIRAGFLCNEGPGVGWLGGL